VGWRQASRRPEPAGATPSSARVRAALLLRKATAIHVPFSVVPPCTPSRLDHPFCGRGELSKNPPGLFVGLGPLSRRVQKRRWGKLTRLGTISRLRSGNARRTRARVPAGELQRKRLRSRVVVHHHPHAAHPPAGDRGDGRRAAGAGFGFDTLYVLSRGGRSGDNGKRCSLSVRTLTSIEGKRPNTAGSFHFWPKTQTGRSTFPVKPAPPHVRDCALHWHTIKRR
jgi:hypothetical protein